MDRHHKRGVRKGDSTDTPDSRQGTDRHPQPPFSGIENRLHTCKRSRKMPHGLPWKKIKIKAWLCHTTVKWTPLAPSKISHSVQVHNPLFPSFRWETSTISLCTCYMYTNHCAHSILQQNDYSKQNKNKIGWTFFWLHYALWPSETHGPPNWQFHLPSKLSRLN